MGLKLLGIILLLSFSSFSQENNIVIKKNNRKVILLISGDELKLKLDSNSSAFQDLEGADPIWKFERSTEMNQIIVSRVIDYVIDTLSSKEFKLLSRDEKKVLFDEWILVTTYSDSISIYDIYKIPTKEFIQLNINSIQGIEFPVIPNVETRNEFFTLGLISVTNIIINLSKKNEPKHLKNQKILGSTGGIFVTGYGLKLNKPKKYTTEYYQFQTVVEKRKRRSKK